LGLRVLGVDGKLDLSCASHENGSLPRALIERLAIQRVAGHGVIRYRQGGNRSDRENKEAFETHGNRVTDQEGDGFRKGRKGAKEFSIVRPTVDQA
jgi:hypothetical protein